MFFINKIAHLIHVLVKLKHSTHLPEINVKYVNTHIQNTKTIVAIYRLFCTLKYLILLFGS